MPEIKNRMGISSPIAALNVAGRIQMTNSWLESNGGDDFMVSRGIKPVTNNIDNLRAAIFKWRDIWAQNGNIQTSDKRLKKDVQNLDYGLKSIMQLNPVRFRWNEGFDDSYMLGLIAQDLQAVVGEVVKTHYYEISEDGASAEKKAIDRLGVYYSDLIPVLINAVKEQQVQTESLKQEIQ